MLNLIQNEQMKIYRRLRTWILALLLIIIVVMAALVSHPGTDANDNWKARAADTIEHNKKELESTDLPDKFKQKMKEDMVLQQYMLDHDYPPADNTLWGGALRASGLIVLVTLFTVIIAGDMVAGEFTWGTIKLLLIRPASRAKILLAKYVTTLLFAATLLIVMFITAIIVNGFLYGFQNISLPHLTVDAAGQVHEGSMLVYTFATYGLKLIELVMIVTLAFMISTVFRSSSLAIGLSIFIMFAGQVIAMLLLRYSWGKYFLFANTDLTPYLEGQPIAEGMSLGFSIAVLVFYFLLFNILSWEIFRRRDVAA
ncbi:ABC transporter permease [Paenibacillus aceris]|uniref:ABC-2 type transport system permease protein n=1 Tax=Paenibacillus aceris TaxID=869555 RepID=A0ABS4I2I3_9BACL|nr:ABC transporter permease [Paenibacillus aceris]MBP1965137.1 ABC-2 type transport system permease protein [Paenibacillus aceris]NHW33118.1 ABC transporter permease [Paenibacillus aceris]